MRNHAYSLPICAAIVLSLGHAALEAEIVNRGGTALGSFSDPTCFYGYYNPTRYYHMRTSQVDNVLQNNANQSAQRVRMPVWWTSGDPYESDPSNCDIFHTDQAGTLNPLLIQNLNNLFASLANKGYWEVLMSIAPQTVAHWSDPQWTGSLESGWTTYNQQVLDMNINFTKNLFSHVFLTSTNRGLWVAADLGGEIVPPKDSNCANFYPQWRCPDMRYHVTYGRTANYIYEFWKALANHMFTDGSSSFPGKNRIYGFSPDPNSITGLYAIYDLPNSPGRPYAFPIGLYPSPNSVSAAQDMFTQMHNTLVSIGEPSLGVILSETWYNDYNVAVGFKNAINSTGRGVHFLIQWPLAYPSTMVVPTNYDKYSGQGF